MLLCFEAAARVGSFAKAAEQLSLTSSAVSRSIQSLEEFLGVKLFERERQRVLLNDIGKGYLKSVSELLEKLEVETALTIARSREDPVLKLATFPTFGSRWLMPRLQEFTRKYPDIVLDFTTGVKAFDVHSGSIDVAIQYATDLQPNTYSVKLWDESLIAIMPPDFRAPEEEDLSWIAKQRLLFLRTRNDDWAIWFRHLNQEVPKGQVGPVFETFSMLIGAVRAGLGIALVPHIYVQEELNGGSLVAPYPRSVKSGAAFYAFCDEKRREEPNIQILMEWLHSISDR
tara:strand:+ start:1798 stop:2655 length:858 start_codon:yes stop_codon:yes gene_type:complete